MRNGEQSLLTFLIANSSFLIIITDEYPDALETLFEDWELGVRYQKICCVRRPGRDRLSK